MKLNTFLLGTLYYRLPEKWLLVMKITFLLLLASLMTVSASSLAQKITLDTKGAKLETVLEEFKKQSGYNFIIDEQLLDNAPAVTLHLRQASIDQALEQAFKNQQLTYTLEDKVVTIREKKTTILDKIKAVFNNIDVTGRVLDERGQPIPGASISVKNSNQLTITDESGDFILHKVAANEILVISVIGYEKKEVIITTADLGVIRLTQATSKLDEVQIQAYGVTSQRLNTGDIGSVKGTAIEKQPVNNPLLALEGRVSGLSITENSGLPGGGVTVRIRGQNSLIKGNDPLYIVDGIPYTSQLLPTVSGILSGPSGYNGSAGGSGSPLSYLNPQDIESIDVLKDAGSTAIYGSRGANGVILITTKKGKAGQTKVDFNIQTGVGDVARNLPVLNTQQYLEMRHEAYKNDNATPSLLSGAYDLLLWDTTRNTNWQKELIGRTAHYTDATASISGGNANTNFLVGTGIHRETTVFPGNLADQKGSVHFNMNNTSTNRKFRFELSANYMVDASNLIDKDLTLTAISMPPDAPNLFNNDGTLNWAQTADGSSTWKNPLAYLSQKYTNQTNNLISNSVVSYQLLPDLNVKSSFGYTNLQTNETLITPLSFYAPEIRPNVLRSSRFANGNLSTWIIEPQVTFKREILKGLFEGVIGATFQQNSSNRQDFSATGFNSDQVMGDIQSASSVTVVQTNITKYRYEAFYGRLNYNLNNKYIVDFTGRRDGSSRFGSENQFHNFWSAAGAWLFSNEDVIKNKLPFLSHGKIRLSYGTTGNDQIGDYQYLNLYFPLAVSVPYQGIPALQVTGIPNPYLQWEETRKLEFGLDLGFLKDRLLMNISYYKNNSSNQLTFSTLPYTTGFGNIEDNFAATVQNYGFEFSLNTNNLKSKDFSWTSNINLSLPRNKLIDYPDLATSGNQNLYVVGYPLSIKKGYHFLGVDPSTGLYTVANSEGLPVSSGLNFTTDKNVLKNTGPVLFGGFENDFRYKSFELSVLLQFVKQNASSSLALGNYPGYFYSDNSNEPSGNQPVWVMDRWRKPGEKGLVQQFSANYPDNVSTAMLYASLSDQGIVDASYIRLKNLSLSWQVPENWIRKLQVQSLRFYLQSQNLVTITKYKGLDPENLSSTSLPPLRVITLGLHVGL